jgi:uracil-DNA glycosylase family 4
MGREIRKLAWQIAAHADWQAQSGVRAIPQGIALPAPRETIAAPAEMGVMPPETLPVTSQRADEPSVVDATAAAADLAGLQAAIGDCQRCRLAKGRTKLVFGVGNPNARLMFVGEGPGRDEDLKGEPFVGRAGMLLTDIIEKGMRLARADVYICNVVKCRPPENRNPEPDEVETCSPFLLRQIALVRPEVIVALGKFAAQTLLQSKTPITRLRGQWFEYHGVPLMPTLHPAYLLRNPGDKKLVWQDIKSVMARLGLPS